MDDAEDPVRDELVLSLLLLPEKERDRTRAPPTNSMITITIAAPTVVEIPRRREYGAWRQPLFDTLYSLVCRVGIFLITWDCYDMDI